MDNRTWKVKRCKEKHWSGVREIWENRITTSREHITVWLNEATRDDNQISAVVVTDERDDVVGFGFYAVGDRTRMDSYLQNAELDNAIKHRQGIIETIAVKETFENKGIASSILKYELEMLCKKGVDYAYSISWNRENITDSRALFDKFGFIVVSQIKNYYEKLPDTIACIDCDGKCTCDATIYKKELTRKDK